MGTQPAGSQIHTGSLITAVGIRMKQKNSPCQYLLTPCTLHIRWKVDLLRSAKKSVLVRFLVPEISTGFVRERELRLLKSCSIGLSFPFSRFNV